ncbi:TonB-dependent receptor [uncultured Helicobacter sp.]|uniref:TonB-dependent receptor domain-containing protein n=1 Tax=uncultured Helicobacter sp. TaxID=175537 RepID=UPI00263841C4|nr:TonB-dependent receptor [uncultured Helicobacter sp.]
MNKSYFNLTAALLVCTSLLADSQSSEVSGGGAYNNSPAKEPFKSINLGRSVITASGFEQDLNIAPASISVVTPQDIQSRPVRDLAEALANVPGVSIDSGVTKTGGYGISIRGMGTAYTLILIDGKRVNADSSTFPNGFGDSVTSFMPPLSAIERIEVIRGPASTLYGSDAIGGVVNIITKKNYEQWGSNITYDYTFQESRPFGNTQSINFYTAGPLNTAKTLGLILRSRIYTRDGVSNSDLAVAPNHTGVTSNSGQNNATSATASQIVGSAPGRIYNVGTRINWSSTESVGKKPKNNVYLDIDYSQQSYDNSQGLVMSNRNANSFNVSWDDLTFQKNSGYGKKYNIYRGNVVLAHNGSYIANPSGLLSNFSTDTSLTYNITNNAGRFVPQNAASGLSTSSVNGVNAGDSRELINQDIILDHKSNLFLNLGLSFGINTTLGGRYWYNNFNDNLLKVSTGDANVHQHISALFGEAEFILFDKLFITTGVRGNFNSIFGSNISPRAYLAYNVLDDWLTIKGGISTGYKSPSLNQLVADIVSYSGSGTNPTYGNPNLKPESSVNYEFSILSDNDYFSASLTGFYIQFKDKINQTGGLGGNITNGQIIPTLGIACQATSGNCSYYSNADEALSYGTEVFVGIKPINVGYGGISLSAAYTYNHTEITKSNTAADIGIAFTNVPLHSLNASLNYDTPKWGLYIREEYKDGIYRGNPNGRGNIAIQARAAGEFYDPYYLTHTGGYYKFKDNLRLNLAIYNLLNFNFINYIPYTNNNTTTYTSAYNYIREGRRYYLSVQMDF